MNIIESQLDSIEHYKRIQEMKPYIGENYFSADRKILILGESHFFDHEPKTENPECNPGATVWYSYKVTIPEAKLDYINTREIVKNGSHKIFSNLKTVLAEVLKVDKDKALENIAFMNTFQRPANHRGVSFKALVQPIDCAIAIYTISKVIEILKPDFVIFTSKLSWDKVGLQIKEIYKETQIVIDFTSHPNSHEWSSEKGRQKFIKIFSS